MCSCWYRALRMNRQRRRWTRWDVSRKVFRARARSHRLIYLYFRYLLVPDYEHSMNIVAFSQAYPTAKCIGPEGIDSKQPSVTWAGILGAGGESKKYGFEDEIKLHYFSGHMNKEIAVLHIPSKTLLCADLVFNLPPTEGYKQTSQSGEAVWPVNKLQESLQPGTTAHSVVGTLTGKDKE